MGKSWKENVYKKNFGSKKTIPKNRGKSNKELELLENGYSEEDLDLSYNNNNDIDMFGNSKNSY